MTDLRKNLILLASVVVVSLLFCEVAFRLLNGISPFDPKNFRESRAILVNLNDAIRYDERLGWVHKDNLRFGGFTTAEHGVRRHKPDQAGARTGGVLLVGSSFAAGSEVNDTETWAAQLEEMLGQPVENASVGGYGADQVLMRAEQLIPVFEPSTLIVQLMDTSIQWIGYSHLGWPKPYYTIADGKLAEHNVPVPRAAPREALPEVGWLKWAGSYSAIVDRIMSNIDAESWYAQSKTVKVENDPVGVACALLQRLKTRAEEKGLRTILVTMSAASDVISSDVAPGTVLGVENCAGTIGYEIVSVFDRMHALYRQDPNNMPRMYVPHGPVFGHSTVEGNHEIALLVAKALRAPPARVGSTN